MRVYAGDTQEKIADLETRVNGLSREIGIFGTSFETRLAAAEKSLRKQCVVNEALLAYLETQHPFKYGHAAANELGTALHEALEK